MIQLRMSVPDLARMRFAYSPLTEVGESLYLLHSGRTHPLHQGWDQATGARLRRADTELLRAVVPARGYIADFFLGAGASDATTTIEQQLHALADTPPQRLHAELKQVWAHQGLPPAAQTLLRDRSGAAARLADALHRYWQLAIEPDWSRIRALYDADVAHRAARLTRGGIEALLCDLHPDLHLQHGAIHVAKPHNAEHDLTGSGLLLIPCAFAGPNIIVDPGAAGTPSIIYGPRGIGALWQTGTAEPDEENLLAALLGRSRAAILTAVALPRSTTELARQLAQSPPAVSAHLSILRRCALVTSWRSGRRVLYQRTPLANSIIAASITPGPDRVLAHRGIGTEHADPAAGHRRSK
jgi:DNA-binding transcriptional ArsR family regulator